MKTTIVTLILLALVLGALGAWLELSNLPKGDGAKGGAL